MLKDTIEKIIFAEKQAELYEVKNNKRYKMWMGDAYILRRSIGEFRPWHQLIAIYDLRGKI